MNKKIIIVVAVVLLVAVVVFWVLRSKSSTQFTAVVGGEDNSPQQWLVVGALPAARIPAGSTIEIGTPEGTVTVKNFYRVVVAAEDEFVFLKQTESYEITHNTVRSSFFVQVKEAPATVVQKAAENDLLGILGINQVDACKLEINIGVSLDADKNLAGKTYPLSFCPNNVQ